MGYFIAFLIIAVMAGFIRGTWNLLFRPIFAWIGEKIMELFMRLGMGRLAARALLSVVIIVAIIIIVAIL